MKIKVSTFVGALHRSRPVHLVGYCQLLEVCCSCFIIESAAILDIVQEISFLNSEGICFRIQK